MNHHYLKVIGCILLSFTGYSLSIAQSTAPEFLECSSTTDSLCVQDEGVRLPASNQIYLGEGHPDATSCSVHITQKKLVLSTCGGPLHYEVQLYINDTSAAVVLKPLTSITTDSNGMAELYFDTEESPVAQISNSGIPYTSGCQVYHRIKWIVTDTCGIESVCEQLVDLYDCQKASVSAINHPNPYFFTHSAYIMAYGEDLVSAEDDCTNWEDFLMSFDSLSHQATKEFYFCDIPGFGIEIPYNLWIADRGRDINCDGVIAWLERNIEKQEVVLTFIDNTTVIECFPEHTIEGEIRTERGEGIKDVVVELSSPGQVFPTYITEADGKYYFYQVWPGNPVTIRPERNDKHKNGVSTLDLVKIQKHLLGQELFTSPYQSIAADVNNSQAISAIDLIVLRRLILGIYTEFPSNQSWRFVRKDFVFGDTLNPWPIVDASTITITDIENPENTDFIGIKIGDVNGTAQPHFNEIKERGSQTLFNLVSKEQAYEIGDVLKVPIRNSSSQTLTGLQFTLHTAGMEILDVLPGRISLSEGEYAFFGDKMTISWFDENRVNISAEDVLFTLVLKANHSAYLSESLSINSDITDAEIYLDDDQTFIPVMHVVNSNAETDLKIVSCAPNPWRDETTVFFYLPEASNVTYNVIDVDGRKVYSDEDYLKEGYHSYTLKAADFSARGMLFLEIGAGMNTVVQKTVLME